MVLATRVTELWQLFVLWGLVLGCGTGLTARVLGAVVANRWFTARRGLVVGVLAGSTATGQLIFLPAAAWLIEHAGWRYAVIPVFVACVVSCLPHRRHRGARDRTTDDGQGLQAGVG